MFLHQVHPRDVNDLDRAISSGRSILIADNKNEARFNISDVEVVHGLGYSNARESIANSFSLTIQEPNNSRFMESLATSAKVNLGLDNHLTARYILGIEFIGRRPNGASKRFSTVFHYGVMIENIEIQINEQGSTYQISAFETNASAVNYLENALKNTITVEAETVGQFFQEFTRRLEKSLENELLFNPNQLYPDSYTIEFDTETGANEWLSYNIEQTEEVLPISGVSLTADGKMQFNLQNGSNVTSIVGTVLQCTAEYKKIHSHEGGFLKDSAEKPASADLDQFAQFYKIVPKVEFGAYDPLRGDFVRNITYKVIKHITPDVILDAGQYTRGITNGAVQNSRVQKLNDLGLLKKRYDYIFTGLNTEVLNLDLKFDLAYYQISVAGQGAVGDATVDASANAAGQVEPPGQVHDQLATLKNEIAQLATQRRTLEARRDSIQAEGTSPNDVASLQEEIDSLNNQIDVKNQDLIQLGDQITQTFNPPAQGGGGSFISNTPGQQQIAVPIRFAADVVDDSETYGPENDMKGGRLQFGGVKANIENSADMLIIEMNIKGDPYWLGKPNSWLADISGEVANYEQGANMLYLNVKFPQEETGNGQRVPKSDYTLTGVYRVNSVISRFSGGLFTQYLEAYRDLATNTITVSTKLEGADTSQISRSADGERRIETPDNAQIQEDSRPQ